MNIHSEKGMPYAIRIHIHERRVLVHKIVRERDAIRMTSATKCLVMQSEGRMDGCTHDTQSLHSYTVHTQILTNKNSIQSDHVFAGNFRRRILCSENKQRNTTTSLVWAVAVAVAAKKPRKRDYRYISANQRRHHCFSALVPTSLSPYFWSIRQPVPILCACAPLPHMFVCTMYMSGIIILITRSLDSVPDELKACAPRTWVVALLDDERAERDKSAQYLDSAVGTEFNAQLPSLLHFTLVTHWQYSLEIRVCILVDHKCA